MDEDIKDVVEKSDPEADNKVDRRQFLKRWSKIVAGAVILGGAVSSTSIAAEGQAPAKPAAEGAKQNPQSKHWGWRCNWRCYGSGDWRCSNWRCDWRCYDWRCRSRCSDWRCTWRCTWRCGGWRC